MEDAYSASNDESVSVTSESISDSDSTLTLGSVDSYSSIESSIESSLIRFINDEYIGEYDGVDECDESDVVDDCAAISGHNIIHTNRIHNPVPYPAISDDETSDSLYEYTSTSEDDSIDSI
jgi:hypothetical protein